jgi:uncharacterized protein YdhG (YjbR/CyaY superfamily)
MATKTQTRFTEDEQAAMRERARELKAESRRRGKKGKADGERDLLAKVAEMEGTDRAIAERLHEIVKATAPELESKTWYGMPAYASEGKVVLYFKCAKKFKSRYATLGFNDAANLDDGAMWPTEFAITKLTGSVEKRIGELVKQAVA